MKVSANPHIISRQPTTRLNHFDGIFMFSRRAKGKTLAYLTYSVLCEEQGCKMF